MGPEQLGLLFSWLATWLCRRLGSSQGLACFTIVPVGHTVLDTCEVESLSCAAPVGTFELSAISWSAVAQASASLRLSCTCSVILIVVFPCRSLTAFPPTSAVDLRPVTVCAFEICSRTCEAVIEKQTHRSHVLPSVPLKDRAGLAGDSTNGDFPLAVIVSYCQVFAATTSFLQIWDVHCFSILIAF